MKRTYFFTGVLVVSLIYLIESCIGRRRMIMGTCRTDVFFNNNQNAVFSLCIQFYMVIFISRIQFWSCNRTIHWKIEGFLKGDDTSKRFACFCRVWGNFYFQNTIFLRLSPNKDQINGCMISVSFNCPQWVFLEKSLGLLLLCNGQ